MAGEVDVSELDLLNPSSVLQQNYVNQLRQTVDAYSPAFIVLGEVVQNSLDAVREIGGGKHRIDIELDLDNHPQ